MSILVNKLSDFDRLSTQYFEAWSQMQKFYVALSTCEYDGKAIEEHKGELDRIQKDIQALHTRMTFGGMAHIFTEEEINSEYLYNDRDNNWRVIVDEFKEYQGKLICERNHPDNSGIFIGLAEDMIDYFYLIRNDKDEVRWINILTGFDIIEP